MRTIQLACAESEEDPRGRVGTGEEQEKYFPQGKGGKARGARTRLHRIADRFIMISGNLDESNGGTHSLSPRWWRRRLLFALGAREQRDIER